MLKGAWYLKENLGASKPYGGISNSFNRKNVFFSPNNVSFLREESVMEFSHVGSSSEVNETWSLCLRRVQHGVFLHELSGFLFKFDRLC